MMAKLCGFFMAVSGFCTCVWIVMLFGMLCHRGGVDAACKVTDGMLLVILCWAIYGIVYPAVLAAAWFLRIATRLIMAIFTQWADLLDKTVHRRDNDSVSRDLAHIMFAAAAGGLFCFVSSTVIVIIWGYFRPPEAALYT